MTKTLSAVTMFCLALSLSVPAVGQDKNTGMQQMSSNAQAGQEGAASKASGVNKGEVAKEVCGCNYSADPCPEGWTPGAPSTCDEEKCKKKSECTFTCEKKGHNPLTHTSKCVRILTP